jgi:arginase
MPKFQSKFLQASSYSSTPHMAQKNMYKSISIILSPFHCGRHKVGPGLGPDYLLTRGLETELKALNIPISVSKVQADAVLEKDGEIAQSYETFRQVSTLVSAARQNSAFPVILSGNCSTSVGVAAGLCHNTTTTDTSVVEKGGARNSSLGCVWFDAHDDIHTPDTLTSGYGDSMALSLLSGSCFKRMLQSVPGYQPLDLSNFIHVGMRDVDDQERELVRLSGLDVIWGGADKTADFGKALSERLQRKRLGSTMVHVDLDSLDSSIGKANKFATPGGLLADDLASCLNGVATHAKPESLTLASFDPSFEGADAIADVAIQATKKFLVSILSLSK